MIRFRSIATLLVLAALAVCAHSQGSTGGLLYASDFAKWTLPQGNTPAKGAIVWPNQETCKISPAGYNSPALKVGRRVTIVDANPSLTETVTPSAISSGNSGCMMAATMVNSHSSYQITSGTAGLQEALDYQASFSQGAVIVLTPAWTAAGGTTGMITSAAGYAGASILDERTSKPTAYTWNGSVYVANPFALMTTGTVAGNCATIGTGNTITDTGAPCSTGSGSVTGQASGVVPLATGATAIGSQSHLDDGVTLAGTVSVSEPLNVPTSIASGQPTSDLRHPGFAGGIVCDNATDIGPAMQAAVNGLPAGGGEIQIVCQVSPNNAYWANPNTLTYGSKAVTVKIQGGVRLGTSWTLGNSWNVIGMSGSQQLQFQGPAPNGFIYGPAGTGTLGTSVTAAYNAPSTVTFTPSVMTGLYANTWLMIADTVTCTNPSVVRSANAVVATFSSTCHIPPGSKATIAGVTDSSFNGIFQIAASDYVTNTLSWTQTAANASSSGGTMTGFFEDSVESLQVTSCASTTCTATFRRNHNATAQWGISGLVMGPHALLRGIGVQNATGAQIMFPTGSGGVTSMIDSSASANACGGQLTSFPIEVNRAFWFTLENVALLTGCTPWGLHLTNSFVDGAGQTGIIKINNSVIAAGIKADYGANGVTVRDTIIETGARGGIQYDGATFISSSQASFILSNVELQDNFVGYHSCLFYQLTPWPASNGNIANASVDIHSVQTIATPCLTNDYFNGPLRVDNMIGPTASYALKTQRGVVGKWDDGKTIDAEVRGGQAGFAPAVVPHATLPIVTSPASWSTAGGCTVTPGVAGPDGTTSAGALTKATGVGNSILWTSSGYTPAVGDRFVYGVWVNTPTLGSIATAGGQGAAIQIDTVGSSHYSLDNAYSNIYDSLITDDWWHPVVAVSTVATADGSAATARLAINCVSTHEMDYAFPFAIFVPASENIPAKEIMRWRQQLLHGFVPASAVAGQAYSLAPVNLPADPTANLQAATKQYVDSHTSAPPSVPAWLFYLGDGTETAPVCTSGCNVTGGEHWYPSLNVPAGQVMYASQAYPLVIRSTGTCTIAGTISVSPNTGSFPGISQVSNLGGSGGGGGFGASNGAVGSQAQPNSVGAAGTSGVAGGVGGTSAANFQKAFISGFYNFIAGIANSSSLLGGASGGLGQGNGTAVPKGAGAVVIDCATINFTGTIDASGVAGAAGGANIGGNGGSGAGIVILRSPAMTNSGTINTAGGAGGTIGTGTSTAGGAGGAGWSSVYSK